MGSKKYVTGMRRVVGRALTLSLAILLTEAMALASTAPAATTGKAGKEDRVVNYHVVNRAEIENLQRWVAAGHEDWCKDARAVATEELKRIAAGFPGEAAELNAIDLGEAAEGGWAKKVQFEWTPFDGRATYRVTVERFEWLLPIAKDAEAVVWFPTTTEIQIHE